MLSVQIAFTFWIWRPKHGKNLKDWNLLLLLGKYSLSLNFSSYAYNDQWNGNLSFLTFCSNEYSTRFYTCTLGNKIYLWGGETPPIDPCTLDEKVTQKDAIDCCDYWYFDTGTFCNIEWHQSLFFFCETFVIILLFFVCGYSEEWMESSSNWR
jgi:hypothetical protein